MSTTTETRLLISARTLLEDTRKDAAQLAAMLRHGNYNTDQAEHIGTVYDATVKAEGLIEQAIRELRFADRFQALGLPN
jgi:hypothetical protein